MAWMHAIETLTLNGTLCTETTRVRPYDMETKRTQAKG